MTARRVFVTRRIPAPGIDALVSARVDYEVGQESEDQQLSRRALLEGVADCDVLLSLLTENIDREILEASRRLLGVANMAVGFDNIDLETATELGIPVTNTPGVLTDTTADFTWAMLLAVARRIPESHNYAVAGSYRIWGPNLFLGHDVSPGGSGRPKTLGIVGYGAIGQAVARRAQGFSMSVVVHDPGKQALVDSQSDVRWAELDELLETSDFVTLHTTLTPATHHLIGERELRLMKSNALLINAARGPIVDEEALITALEHNWIGGAALDVYEDEPEIPPRLREQKSAVLFPHIASASHDTRGSMASTAAQNALCHLRGEHAPDVLNPEVYQTDAYRKRNER